MRCTRNRRTGGTVNSHKNIRMQYLKLKNDNDLRLDDFSFSWLERNKAGELNLIEGECADIYHDLNSITILLSLSQSIH